MTYLRRLLLKTMLWALGFGAAAGVVAILMGGDDVVVRVMATAFITAAAALLMIPFSFLIDRRRTQTAGLFVMAAIVAEYIVWVLFTWLVDTRAPYDLDERLGITGLWLLLAILPLGISLRLITNPRGRIAGWCATIVCGVAFICLMVGAWWPGSWWSHAEHWWGSALAVFTFGVLAAACIVRPGEGMIYVWRWLGPPTAAAGLVMALVGIWQNRIDAIAFTVVTGAAVAMAHANLMLLVPMRPGQRWLRVATIGAVIVTVLLIDLLVTLVEFRWGLGANRELVERSAGAAGILACCGSLGMLVLARLNRRVEFEPLKDMPMAITVICPRCRRKTKVALGEGHCDACRLRIEINVEEPRCPECGYLLYKLASDVCPECGTSIQSGPSEETQVSM